MLVGQAAAAGGGRHRVAAGHDRGPASGRLAARLTLAAVLAAQALISIWLTGRNTAYQDEALYLWAGRLEWARWLHGSRIPIAFPGYFSGSSVVYPPIAAVADSLGGLTGARLLSTCFMLAATWLLWSATRRLLDERAALFAAAVFAFTGSALFLGAFATYDAMALLLLAAAAWTALRSAGQSRRRQVGLLALMVLLLLVANAAKYASALWDPVVLALAALADVRTRGWRSGVRTGLAATAGLGLLIVAAVLAGGHSYLAGIEFSTVSRSLGTQPPATVLAASAAWIGLVAVAAIAGAVIVTRRGAGSGMALTGWVLAAAVLLAPAEQAIRHRYFSLIVIRYVSVRYRDQAIAALVTKTPGYRLVAMVPWSAGRRHGRFWVWRWTGRRAGSARG